MKTRHWEWILRRCTPDAFLLWLLEQPKNAEWCRESVGACPLHDFIEAVTGYSLCINSPDLSEHWAERPTQEYPMPWWMKCILRSVDRTGDEDRISQPELLSITLIVMDDDFDHSLNSKEEWELAA